MWYQSLNNEQAPCTNLYGCLFHSTGFQEGDDFVHFVNRLYGDQLIQKLPIWAIWKFFSQDGYQYITIK